MFSKKKMGFEFSDLISELTVIRGEIIFSGSMRIKGRVEGSVQFDPNKDNNNSLIIVDSTGHISGNFIKANKMQLNGNVSCGQIWCEDSIHIGAEAVLENAVIYYRTLSVEDGAKLINCQLKHLDHCSEGEIT